MDLNKTSKILKEKRLEMGLTGKELASKLNISPQAISKWENGKSFPDISILKNVCEILNISVMDLIGNKDEAVYNSIKYINSKTVKKFKKLIKILLIIFILIILLFFLTTYNKFKYYEFENEFVEGYIISSSIYNVFDLKFKDKEANYYTLFYRENDDYFIRSGNINDKALHIVEDYKNIGENSKIFKKINNLYINLETDDKTYDVKISPKLIFKNNKLINLKSKNDYSKSKPTKIVYNKDEMTNDLTKRGFIKENNLYFYTDNSYIDKNSNYALKIDVNNGNILFIGKDNNSNNCVIEVNFNNKEIYLYLNDSLYKLTYNDILIEEKIKSCYKNVDYLVDEIYKYYRVFDKRYLEYTQKSI